MVKAALSTFRGVNILETPLLRGASRSGNLACARRTAAAQDWPVIESDGVM